MEQLNKISISGAFVLYGSASAQKTYELVNTCLTVNEPVLVKFTVTNHRPIAAATYRNFDTTYAATAGEDQPCTHPE